MLGVRAFLKLPDHVFEGQLKAIFFAKAISLFPRQSRLLKGLFARRIFLLRLN